MLTRECVCGGVHRRFGGVSVQVERKGTLELPAELVV